MDYTKIGLKVGLEVHRQLNTNKLFCNCPSVVRDDKPDIITKRRLRASAGEAGEIDIAAAEEQAKGKYYVYHAYNDTTCLVELDESPPEELNKEALNVALQVAFMLNSEIPDRMHVMRKIVVDGSAISAFQRTVLIGMNGFIEVENEKINILTICLEEDAAKIEERKKEYAIYNLSRLGIPLIEIATSPDIKTPEQAKRVAEYIGMVLKSTGKAKSGIGTIRQDINVSVKGGARVEIKGAQELKMLPKIVELEAERQISLIKQNKKVQKEVRKAKPDGTTEFLRQMPGAARLYPETDIPLIKTTKEMLSSIKIPKLIAEKAEEFEGIGLSKELAGLVLKSDKKELFEELIGKYGHLEPEFIANTLIVMPKEIKSRLKLDASNIKGEHYGKIFEALTKNRISRDAVFEILSGIAEGKEIDFRKYERLSDAELEKEIKKIVAEQKEMPINALIGKVMGELRGKAEGKRIVELVKRFSQQKI